MNFKTISYLIYRFPNTFDYIRPNSFKNFKVI